LAKPLLNFRFLLTFLAWRYQKDEFDTRTVTKDLQAILPSIIDDPRLPERLRPKLISNDLRRLYTMGFLRRERVERECVNKHGKRYNCGYKYMYRINNQGWRYLKVLKKKQKVKGDFYLMLLEMIDEIKDEFRAASIGLRKLSALKLFERGNVEGAKYLLKDAREDIDKKFKGNGYRRFRLSRILFEERVRCWMIISDLQRELMALREELEAKEKLLMELGKGIKQNKS